MERLVEVTERDLKSHLCGRFCHFEEGPIVFGLVEGEGIRFVQCSSPRDGIQSLRQKRVYGPDPGIIITCSCAVTGYEKVETKITPGGVFVEPPASDINPTRIRGFRRD